MPTAHATGKAAALSSESATPQVRPRSAAVAPPTSSIAPSTVIQRSNATLRSNVRKPTT
jgi:hypothetical protein